MKKQIAAVLTVISILLCLTACSKDCDSAVSLVDGERNYEKQSLTDSQKTAYSPARIEGYYTSGDYKVFYVIVKDGFNGEVEVSILLNGTSVEKIAGINIKESEDYGLKCFRDSFLSQFYGLDLSKYEVLRGKDKPQDEGEIIYLTHATVTSKSIIAAVNAVALFINTQL